MGMSKAKYAVWLKNHPYAILNCKICKKSLGREMVMAGQDFHPHCLKLKIVQSRSALSVHSGEPYSHTLKSFR